MSEAVPQKIKRGRKPKVAAAPKEAPQQQDSVESVESVATIPLPNEGEEVAPTPTTSSRKSRYLIRKSPYTLSGYCLVSEDHPEPPPPPRGVAAMQPPSPLRKPLKRPSKSLLHVDVQEDGSYELSFEVFNDRFLAGMHELAEEYRGDELKLYKLYARDFDMYDVPNLRDLCISASNPFDMWVKLFDYIMAVSPYSVDIFPGHYLYFFLCKTLDSLIKNRKDPSLDDNEQGEEDPLRRLVVDVKIIVEFYIDRFEKSEELSFREMFLIT
jgi:hypothetical protein